MDGAVVLTDDATRILRAAVHLMPDPTIPTEESGTRHRTAERTGLQTGYPVISVSQSMSDHQPVLRRPAARGRQTPPPCWPGRTRHWPPCERYKFRLDEVAGTLSALEIEDLATVRDAMTVLQRLVMVRRIADEIDQLRRRARHRRPAARPAARRAAGRRHPGLRELLIRDYLPPDEAATSVDEIVAALDDLRRGRRCRPDRGGQGARAVHPRRRPRRRRSARAATGCWPASRGCRRPCWTA